MKFLHTADLHIGKRLEGRLRLDEQKSVLDEIVGIARAEKIDLALVAGDVFDVGSPLPEAKKVFYHFALQLAAICPFVAIAGNHDSTADLSAPSELADAADIKLIGEPTCLEYTFNGEKTHIAAIPYPDEKSVKDCDGTDYYLRVQKFLHDNSSNFVLGENNILLSHLFMTGASEEPDENSLGPARMLPKTVLPINCYSALGHIHKPSVVSKTNNAYYAGSPLCYHFDGENEKSVIIAEMKEGRVIGVERKPLSSGKRLVVVEVKDFDGAIAALENNVGNLVKLRYVSSVPLSLSETKRLRSYEQFVKLEPIIDAKLSNSYDTLKNKTDEELFDMYYQSVHKSKPTESIMALFNEIMSKAKGE